MQRVDGWIESALKDLRTETAQRIAEAAVNMSPLSWREPIGRSGRVGRCRLDGSPGAALAWAALVDDRICAAPANRGAVSSGLVPPLDTT